MPKDSSTERFLLIDIEPKQADDAARVLAGIASERNDSCGLDTALDALGIKTSLRIEKRAQELYASRSDHTTKPGTWKHLDERYRKVWRGKAAIEIDEEDHGER